MFFWTEKRKFEDLKKSHTETLIPVTKDDFDRRPKFANVESFLRHRNSTKIKPVSMEESQRILLQQEDLDSKNNTSSQSEKDNKFFFQCQVLQMQQTPMVRSYKINSGILFKLGKINSTGTFLL